MQSVQNDDDSDSTSNDGHSRPSSLLKRTKSEVRSHGKFFFFVWNFFSLKMCIRLLVLSIDNAKTFPYFQRKCGLHKKNTDKKNWWINDRKKSCAQLTKIKGGFVEICISKPWRVLTLCTLICIKLFAKNNYTLCAMWKIFFEFIFYEMLSKGKFLRINLFWIKSEIWRLSLENVQSHQIVICKSRPILK